jgi:DNA-binding XRE family transcriptional regulator
MLDNNDIRLVRNLMGLKQHELAKKVGVSASLISAIELGKRKLNNQLKEHILSTFDLNVEDINAIAKVKAGLRV